ncbi:hypothetical protein [Gorillibacterium massiliense]|uniref:hypothetical protein n=1 Tax=Gorillibacterium massiliense TaxID=1280390 RepID=UPI0004B287D8|nr:hypothetical protein [Gorillibacterium massiliense]
MAVEAEMTLPDFARLKSSFLTVFGPFWIFLDQAKLSQDEQTVKIERLIVMRGIARLLIAKCIRQANIQQEERNQVKSGGVGK